MIYYGCGIVGIKTNNVVYHFMFHYYCDTLLYHDKTVMIIIDRVVKSLLHITNVNKGILEMCLLRHIACNFHVYYREMINFLSKNDWRRNLSSD